jgi:CheY-like chemotaxis protein
LDTSKIEAGKIELSPVDYDFHSFLNNISSMFEYVVHKKSLEFEFECGDGLPDCLYGDDIRLRQILTNICGNAVKFTKTGSVGFKVYAAAGNLYFIISDTGIGIRKEDLPRLFNAFMQADIAKNRGIVGTGLGLYISKAFVEMMGGNITVESEYGHGTSFTVMIPMVQGNKENIQYKKELEKDKYFYAPSSCVLVVDDNEFNLKVAVGMLNLYRIDAKIAFSGKEAIGMIQENDFDIIFMDHMMPEMDGVEATNKIRALGGKYEDIAIIALTGNAVKGAKEMFLANGFNELITKPIDALDLNSALEKWLPPEKVRHMQETGISGPEMETQADENPVVQRIINALGSIVEINTEVGLRYASDIKEMYCETVKLFFKKVMPECKKMASLLNYGDLAGFAVSVHSMKSMLACIGAINLSESAFQLEMAAKKNDFEFCAENYPVLAEDLFYLNGLLAVIFPVKEYNTEKKTGDAVQLRDYVQKALAAADAFNNDMGIEAVSVLLPFNFGDETNALLESAMAAFNNFDFDKALDSLEAIK